MRGELKQNNRRGINFKSKKQLLYLARESFFRKGANDDKKQ
jgi:hypothetical protein